MSDIKRAIWWVRRDLRLRDNEALTAARETADQVIPVFIFDPALLNSPYVGDKRIAFLLDGLRALDADSRQRNGRLIIRRGDPVTELQKLREETGATAVFAAEDFSPYARQRDQAAADAVPLQLAGSTAIRPPGTVMKEDGDPYVVYTPFSRTWKEQGLPREDDLLPAPKNLDTPDDIASEPIPDAPALPDSVPFPAGEPEARRRLEAFISNPIADYAQKRNRVDLDGTSQLSPYLRFGMISPRETAVAALEARAAADSEAAGKGANTWLNEIIWREFYIHILAHFPHVAGGNFRPAYDLVQWRDDEKGFAAWCNGRTGYPIVDAAMRQLQESGWMHNRARMVVASFLVKDLLINWRRGERYFMQHLVDGDLASNNGGWQWTAGTGTDAAPYFRIFNPVSQGKKHDPDGAYVRRWVPELANVPDKYLQQPWTMPPDVQEGSDCIIGRDYPAPIVDHQEARQRTLDAYKEARAAAET